MLVLARNVGEEIVIGGDIVVTVVAVRGGTVRLGIAAPASVCVDRREVHQRRVEFTAGEENAQLLGDAPVIRAVLGGLDGSPSKAAT